MKITSICCIGAGYVGGPTMAVIAYHCPEIKITIVDVNWKKIQKWNGPINNLPVKEPGLDQIIKKVRNKNLFFSSDIKNSIQESQMIFIAVNTPTAESGPAKGMGADLTNVIKTANQIAKFANTPKIVVEKSTLPVRTAEKLKEILERNGKTSFDIISNPEFLAEGTAIKDLFKSDRVLIGGEETISGRKATKHLMDIYSKWIPKNRILLTNVWSSELSKLASNAMLAQRISSINSLSAFCEKTGADIIEVSRAIGMDKRIGKEFLKPSVGFGGSCFQKDILNLVYISKKLGLKEVAEYWEQVIKINDYQKNRFSKKIEELTISKDNPLIAVLGWAFKKQTNDSRESASIHIVKNLLIKDYKINIYDPWIKKEKIMDDILITLKKLNSSKKIIASIQRNIQVCDNINDCVEGSDSIAICTEWDEFKDFDWKSSFKNVNNNCVILDGRNLLNVDIIKKIGFKIYSLGRQ